MKKIAFITGANRGLGFEISRQLGKLNMTVLIAARNEQSGLEAAKQLNGEGIDAAFVLIDVNDNESINKAATLVKAKYGRLNILVNNAVFFNKENQTPSAISPELLQNYFTTNFFGPVMVTQAFLPLLKQSSAGRIVNMSTSIGSMATMNDPVNTNPKIAKATPLGYSSSKAALNMFTVLLAKELKDTNIKVNSADPGLTQTDMGGSDATYTIEAGARPAVWLACLDEQGPTGGFFSHKKVNPW